MSTSLLVPGNAVVPQLTTNRQQTGDPQTDQIWQRIADLNQAVTAIGARVQGIDLLGARHLATDQLFSSATAADVRGLELKVRAGRIYRFEFACIVRSDTSTVGVAASLTYPPAARFAATMRTMFAADGAGGEWQGAITASDDPVVPTDVPAANTDYELRIEGVIAPSATGSLQLRARTETGTTTVTVRAGSLAFLWDLGAM